MQADKKTFLAIVLIGVVTGLLFAYFARDIETPAGALILLATVQGSFLAIVISVFLLSLQVNASFFSPLILEQFKRINILTKLIILYVLSILLDLLHLVTLSSPILTHNLGINLTIGVPVCVATICLLSLIPTQQVMAKLVTPETVLRQTTSNVDPKNLLQNRSADEAEEISPPERTPLLTIEQILVSSSKRDDEFTVRQSIYHMHEVISDLLKELQKRQQETNGYFHIEKQCGYVFEYWETCIKIGTNGANKRIDLLHATHTHLTNCLIECDVPRLVKIRLDELVQIHLKAFEIGYVEPALFEVYEKLMENTLNSGDYNLIESIISSILTTCDILIEKTDNGEDYIEYLSGTRRDVIASGLSTSIKCIRIISLSSNINENLFRRICGNAINRIDTILASLFDELENTERGNPDAQGVKQNIITELQSSILSNLIVIYSSDKIVAKNFAIAAIELAVHQGQNPEQFTQQLLGHVHDEELLSDLVKNMKKDTNAESLRRTTTSGKDVRSFIQRLPIATEQH